MGLNLIEMTVDRQVSEFARGALEGEGVVGVWRYRLEDGRVCLRIAGAKLPRLPQGCDRAPGR